jgi:hypothetical protein
MKNFDKPQRWIRIYYPKISVAYWEKGFSVGSFTVMWGKDIYDFPLNFFMFVNTNNNDW